MVFSFRSAHEYHGATWKPALRWAGLSPNLFFRVNTMIHPSYYRRMITPLCSGMVVLALAAGCGGGQTPSGKGSGGAQKNTPPSTPSSGGGDYLSVVAQAKLKGDEAAAAEKLRQIGLALHSYHDTNRAFPTSVPGDQSQKALLSWRVHLLPYLEQGPLYKQFKLDEAWDGPNNKKLLDKMPAVYFDPRFQKKEDKLTDTFFQGWTGKGGVLGTAGGASLGVITNANGASQTFLVVEAADPVPWTKPEDLVHDSEKPLPPLGGPKQVDFLAVFCDGHVLRIPAKTDEKTLRCMIDWMNATPFVMPGTKK
jgi:hypothetical protein